MAKRKRSRAASRKLKTLTLRLPPDAWAIIEKAANVAGLKPDQVVSAILALRLVTMPKVLP